MLIWEYKLCYLTTFLKQKINFCCNKNGSDSMGIISWNSSRDGYGPAGSWTANLCWFVESRMQRAYGSSQKHLSCRESFKPLLSAPLKKLWGTENGQEPFSACHKKWKGEESRVTNP